MELGLIVGAGGVVVTVVLWLLDRRRLKRANEQALRPHIVFGTLELFGPDHPVRPRFSYAVGFSITNLGGPAISPIVWLQDPQEMFKAEPVSRAALVTGQAMTDAMGIEGSALSIDPEADAGPFVRRAEWYVLYWDVGGSPHIFTPTGQVALPEEAHALTPQHLQDYLLAHANRLGPPRGAGAGRG